MVWRIWGCDFGSPEKYFSFISEDLNEILHCVENWPSLPCYNLFYDECKTADDTEFDWMQKYGAFSVNRPSTIKPKCIETIKSIISIYQN